jgi:hypothetical protein
MKIMKGCLLTVSTGIFGILIFGGIVFLVTNDSHLAVIAALLAGTFTPLLTAFTLWVFDHNYWKDATKEIRERLGQS